MEKPVMCVEVEDFGPIAHAKVEVRPLTLFIGENNSGKSWLASLIWGLMSAPSNRFWRGPEDPAWADVQKEWEGLWSARGELDAQQASIDVPLAAERWTELAQRLLQPGLPRVLAWTFLRESFGPHSIKIGMTSGENVWPTASAHLGRVRAGRWPCSLGFPPYYSTLPVIRYFSPADREYLETLLRRFAGIPEPEPANPCSFLPASRTGYLQLYGPLTANAIQAQYGSIETPAPSTTLVQPLVAFLRFLSEPSASGARYAAPDLAELIESQVLQGRLTVPETPGTQYSFRPRGSSVDLEMRHVSSTVSELTPFLILLKKGVPPFLVFEEPEAHLSPKMQRLLARVLVRLVRRGHTLLITTHSDLFAQQLNNFMKLGALREDPKVRDQLHEQRTDDGVAYTEEDYLTPEDMAAYEFRFREDGRTVVEALEKRPTGIVMSPFNREIDAQASEVELLNEHIQGRGSGGH